MSPTSSITTPSTNPPAVSSPGTADPTMDSTSPLANEDTFLKLLVSQLQYQDPLNPVDSTEFVTQLTGYSQLEQLINIDNNTKAAATPSDSSSDTNTTNPTGN